MSKLRRFWWFIWVLLVMVACAPTYQAEDPLPTLAPSPTPAIDMQSAERVSREFLDAWTRLDYEAMHRLITFSDATPFESFQAIYDNAHTTMTLESLDYEIRTLLRESSNVVALNYDVSFDTLILGEFTDTNRTLRLVIDPQLGQWRVAWSLGDILPEMENGARLVFEAQIPSRANIYDRNGEVLADQNGVIVEVIVIKEEIPIYEQCVNSLVEILDKPIEQITDQLDRSGTNWEVVIGTIEGTAYVERHEQLERDCNASFERRATRRYLRGSLMPHILGNVGFPTEEEVNALERQGFNAETIIGRSGIEQSWNDVLSGRPGGRLSLVSATGQRVRVLAEVPSQIPESLWLTIDANLQEYVARVLGEAYVESAEGWGRSSRGASAVVFDVNTGELLAMVSYPSYEGNAFNPYPAVGREVADLVQEEVAEDNRLPQLNRPTQGVYPTGSVMKVMSSIAVLESGVYDENDSIVCTGIWQQENDTRFDWLPGGHGRMTTSTGITNSCNPFFYEVGYQLDGVDPNLLPSYARRMGLGEPTGLTDIQEQTGIIPDPEFIRRTSNLPWTFSFTVNLSIGQGEVQVTPLQMVRMYAAVANGGLLLRPRLVRETGILNQRTFIAEPDVISDADLSAQTLRIVREGMCNVTVANSGTATHIFRDSPLQNLGVCGKTGTAQAFIDGRGAAPHSWFIAYAPRENPEIAVVVMVENSGEGSGIAAPLTRRIMEYYFFGPFD